MRLVLAGERAEFVADASVSSAMPTSLRGSTDQQARWEQGQAAADPPLEPSARPLRPGQARRRADPRRARVFGATAIADRGRAALPALAGPLLCSRRLLALSLITLAAQLVFVLAGLRLVRAPAQVYRALLAAPALIAAKLVLYARAARRARTDNLDEDRARGAASKMKIAYLCS